MSTLHSTHTDALAAAIARDERVRAQIERDRFNVTPSYVGKSGGFHHVSVSVFDAGTGACLWEFCKSYPSDYWSDVEALAALTDDVELAVLSGRFASVTDEA